MCYDVITTSYQRLFQHLIHLILNTLLKCCKSTKPCEDKFVMIMVFQKIKCLLLWVLCLLQRPSKQRRIPGVRCLLITPKRKDRGRSLLFTSGECNKHQELLPETFVSGE